MCGSSELAAPLCAVGRDAESVVDVWPGAGSPAAPRDDGRSGVEATPPPAAWLPNLLPGAPSCREKAGRGC